MIVIKYNHFMYHLYAIQKDYAYGRGKKNHWPPKTPINNVKLY